MINREENNKTLKSVKKRRKIDPAEVLEEQTEEIMVISDVLPLQAEVALETEEETTHLAVVEVVIETMVAEMTTETEEMIEAIAEVVSEQVVPVEIEEDDQTFTSEDRRRNKVY